ncbi:MAG: TfoX/Sxy family protein [Chloroflexi bacterium]|nr:TfoX/Sxy family protein [Chloroflexota bacterium]
MAYNEELAHRVRSVLAPRENITERKMFGGLAFMLNGNMCCCVDKSNLVVRTGPDRYEEALQSPNARVFDLTGRPMRGFVYVDEEGLESESALKDWVDISVAFASSLPAK